MAQKHRDDRFAFSASGDFQVSWDGERLGLILAVLGLLLLLFANVAFFVLKMLQPFSAGGLLYGIKAVLYTDPTWVVALLLLCVVEYFLFRAVRIRILRGTTCYYFADETFFTFRCPKKGVNLSIKYEDVVAVTYHKRRLLWYPRGYTAAITLTNDEVFVFRCITYERAATGRRVLKKPAAFELLEERIEAMRREKQVEYYGWKPF